MRKGFYYYELRGVKKLQKLQKQPTENVIKIFAKFTEKYPISSFSLNVGDLRSAILLKKLHHGCFPLNFVNGFCKRVAAS